MWELAVPHSLGGYKQERVTILSPHRNVGMHKPKGPSLCPKGACSQFSLSCLQTPAYYEPSLNAVSVSPSPAARDYFGLSLQFRCCSIRGCFLMSFHTVHCTDLFFYLICKTDSLAGIQVLHQDAPSFSGNEQITGVLGKGKEVRAYVFLLEGISQRTTLTHRMTLWLRKYLYI